MKSSLHHALAVLLVCGGAAFNTQAAPPAPPPSTNVVWVLEIAGEAEVLSPGQPVWRPARANQALQRGDRFRTRKNSRATLRLTDLSQLRVGELSDFQVQQDHDPAAPPLYKLWRGVLYYFHRDSTKGSRFDSPIAAAAVRGTEFAMQVDDSGRTVLTMIEGAAALSSGQESMDLSSGNEGVAELGRPLRKTAVLRAQLTEAVQWCLYYPAVLNLDELAFREQEPPRLRDSLAAYRRGDLLAALKLYPDGVGATLDSERVYHAALLLAVGLIDDAEAQLKTLSEPPDHEGGTASPRRLAESLRRMVAAVKEQPLGKAAESVLATEWLAESYVRQASRNLPDARQAAWAAVGVAPAFAFGWARVAELEFSFGHLRVARLSLDRALALAPLNAQALALKGFLLSDQNRIAEAIRCFDQAIELDGGLGNAWLGRGLCRIRAGRTREGLFDLQTAAVLEPNRSLLRSYLAKGYQAARHDTQANRELNLARELDTKDPTPWLYAALLKREQNRINEAVQDLEKSIELNNNRGLYRSRFLLDQDHAVRSSSLANIYQSAGLTDVALNEAARSVNYDYANYSAHLFLSESFDALRDPTRFNLRYETVWFNEKLLAGLLGPVGSVPLSQHVSQQEYARLFERDRLGISSATEYRSDGQVRERASQFGTFGSTGYALDLDYQHNDGVRPNNQLDRLEWYSTVKQQLTPQDSLLLLAKYQDYHSGDNFQYYDPKDALPDFKFDEYQHPILVGGYHHEWSPGVHTLFLGGRLVSDERFSASRVPTTVFFEQTGIGVTTLATNLFDLRYHSDLEIYTAELNQIFQSEHHQLVFGGRYQDGRIKIQSQLSNPVLAPGLFNTPAADTPAYDAYQRGSLYSYYTVSLLDRLLLTGGIAYDSMVFPRNFRAPPVVDVDQTQRNLSPKAGFVWSPISPLTLRGAYTRSLSGVSLEQSYRLEPTQVAGFSQTYRSLIPESLAGSLSGTRDQTADLSLNLKLRRQTYLGLQAEWLSSEINQTIGVFNFKDFTAPILPSSTTQRLEYEERSLAAYVSQLVSDEWSLTAQYKFTRSELATFFPQIPSGRPDARRFDSADLHQVGLAVLFNHPSGFFSRVETQGFFQHNAEASAILPNDSFAQLNLIVGYRLPRQHGEVSLGVLNVNDSDYRLNPLNVHPEFPRERVFIARLLLNF